ncbi:hypothetical protein VHUM_00820 [Vanrija humicola]|uniref:Protein kinase domain-containing protein n=1 Tax=Vanrija humicola TaxID=5417 RepID=A0A7D8Z6K5_VANHU|nr:hypothetical protein VHUM_00820 [Vanrija humicola]
MSSFMAPFRLDDTTTPTSAGFSGPVTSLAGQPPLHRREIASSLDSNSQAPPAHRPPTPPLLTPAPGIAFTAHVKSWGPHQIATFLSIYKCDNYTALFHQNDIDGKVLLDLDMASLKEIGIGKIGDRVKLLGGVRDLRKRAAKGNVSASGSGLGPATGSPSRNGSPVPSFEHEGKGAQVPQRLANANVNVSTRLQRLQPPPIKVPPHPTTNPPMTVSPPGRTIITPKPDTRATVTANKDAYPSLRIPPSTRRSPSPGVDSHGTLNTSPSGIPRPTGPDMPIARKIDRRQPTQYRLDNSTPRSVSPPHQVLLQRNVPAHSRREQNLEELARGIVKFVDAEDMTTTKKVKFQPELASGVEALEIVLTKFNKKKEGSVSNFGADIDNDSDMLEVDGWGVYIRSEKGEGKTPTVRGFRLTDSALLDICHGNPVSHHDAATVHENGLLLRKVSQVQSNRKKLQQLLGPYNNLPTSPHSPGLGIPTLTIPSQDAPTKSTRPASTLSILSSLHVHGVEGSPSQAASSTSPSGGGVASKPKWMYSFRGQRPPSELISSHLAEYFPAVKKKELEKTVRQSMLRLSHGQSDRLGMAIASPRSSVENVSSPNRMGRPASTRTVSSTTTPAAIPEEGEITSDAARRPAVDGEAGQQQGFARDSHPPLLPPFESTGESLVDSLQEYSPAPLSVRPAAVRQRRGSSGSNMSRISILSSIRRNRDRSDTASLLTVDEITAEVENRRASMGTLDHESVLTSRSDSDDDSLMSDDDENDYEDDDDDSDATSDEDRKGPARAFTSTGSKRSIKWIKGALIGAGSFGSVYLGMDAQSGLLMAVKQVELPSSSGDVRNEERRRNMVQALEREIDILKELQHENIVTYLDSATDNDKHLNIFLEYVPGGSVAALLSNYGAFEEALVRNFSRQIITGLNYLHERGIIHRDIKGANILVDNKGGIKISDFGISKKAENSKKSNTAVADWQQKSYTSKADIWSVGCLVVEMLTGTHPWAELSQMQALWKVCSSWRVAADEQIGVGGSEAKPPTPTDISPDAASFLQRTFEINHNARPTALALLEHPFIAVSGGGVSMDSATATLEAAAAARKVTGPPGAVGLGFGMPSKAPSNNV